MRLVPNSCGVNGGSSGALANADQYRPETKSLKAEKQIALLADSLWCAADEAYWLQWKGGLDSDQRAFVEALNRQSLFRQARILRNKRWGQVAKLIPDTVERSGREYLRSLYDQYYYQSPLPPGMQVHHRDAFAFIQWLSRSEIDGDIDRLELYRLEFELGQRSLQFRAFKQPDLDMFLNIRGQLIVQIMGFRFEWLFRV